MDTLTRFEHGRALPATVVRWHAARDGERLVLAAGDGELVVDMAGNGEASIDARDRTSGSAFVDALATALGTPLGPPAATGRTRSLRGTFSQHGDRYELVVANMRLALHVSADHARAALVARPHLLVALDRAIGGGRLPAMRHELVLDGGVARLSVPATWRVTYQDECVRAIDPSERAGLDLGCLRAMTARGPRDLELIDRGLMGGWREDAFDAIDHDRGRVRPARSRHLVAATDLVHVVATFNYWCDDASWALPEWERIVSTLEVVRARRARRIAA